MLIRTQGARPVFFIKGMLDICMNAYEERAEGRSVLSLGNPGWMNAVWMLPAVCACSGKESLRQINWAMMPEEITV